MYLIKETPREAMRKVRAHFNRPGARRAVQSNGLCSYRSGGQACAVGCLIPDDQYDARMDNDEWNQHDTSVRGNASIQVERADTLVLLERLQEAHDEAANVTQLRAELRRIADEVLA